MSEKQDEHSVPFYPDHVTLEAKVALGFAILVIIFGVIGLLSPLGLGAPADPMDTPASHETGMVFLVSVSITEVHPQDDWRINSCNFNSADGNLALPGHKTRIK